MLQESLLWTDAGTHAGEQDDAKLAEALRDVDLVITGHTPMLCPTWTGRNVVSIDTGVHFEEFRHLTIAEIQDELKLHRVARTERFD